ncbi:MAG TPA: pirin family protein [Actinomycetota bacterium]|nr:pirin family protein [Actinomycetota bacterium]
MEQLVSDLVHLTPEEYKVLDEDDFGVPGLVAHEVIGPFVRVQALGTLIMVHDGRFEPRHGIGHHPHRFNERLFYILEGAVDHDDALNGIQGHMGTGDVGRLTEGRYGMIHKEWNNTDGPGRAFILVYSTEPTPARASFELLADADAPRYDEASGVRTKELVGPKVKFPLHGDVRFFAASEIAADGELRLETSDGEAGMLFTLDGELDVDGTALGKEHTLLVPPNGSRSVTARAPSGARAIRVVTGPGHGFVTR